MKLIVGLGNPGKEYEKTRHNVGFMVLDELAREFSGQFCAASKFQAEAAETHIQTEKVIFIKPQTFMNNSGEAVGAFVQFYKVEPKDVWVISDDVDLPLGKIRIRDEGSSGGHNGLKSIDQHLDTEAYYHIRVGIGKVPAELQGIVQPDAAKHVLDNFTEKEQKLIQAVIGATVTLIAQGLKTHILETRTISVDVTD